MMMNVATNMSAIQRMETAGRIDMAVMKKYREEAEQRGEAVERLMKAAEESGPAREPYDRADRIRLEGRDESQSRSNARPRAIDVTA